MKHARKVADAVETLVTLPLPSPLVIDDIDGWLPPRSVKALRAHGIKTLADLTVRVPRRRRWWATVPGLGASGAREIEAFFDAHPELTDRARALVRLDTRGDVVPLEQLIVPAEVDGSRGTFRGPVETCTLAARNDYEAVNAWLSMHESASTQRAYRKEAERLILWAVLCAGRRCRRSRPRMRWLTGRSCGGRHRAHAGWGRRGPVSQATGSRFKGICRPAQWPMRCLWRGRSSGG